MSRTSIAYNTRSLSHQLLLHGDPRCCVSSDVITSDGLHAKEVDEKTSILGNGRVVSINCALG